MTSRDRTGGWATHADEQQLAWLALTPAQRLAWLEEAKAFVELARRRLSPAK